MITIHTFGDSHAEFGWTKIKLQNLNIVTHTVGPRLMFSFGRDKLSLLNISDIKYKVKDNDCVCFCFGEIDCRCHIHEFKDEYKNDIESIVNNYMDAISVNVEQLKEIKTMVFNVVPTADSLHFKSRSSKYQQLGTNEERKIYTLYMNNCLLNKCKERNYLFVDIYENYCNEQGLLKYELSDGNVHIKDPCFLSEFIQREILNDNLTTKIL